MVRAPVRAPNAVGVKVKLKVQLEFADNVAGQLLFCAKSPLTATALILKLASPVLVRVTVCAMLAVLSN
jgi:hypothetical protein